MTTYYISRDNNALIDIGSGDFHVSTNQEGVLYVVPNGTPLVDCATASVGTYAVSMNQSSIYVPDTYRVCVISAYRGVEMFVSPLHLPEPATPAVKQKIWAYKDDTQSYAQTMAGHTFRHNFEPGNYQFYLRGYTMVGSTQSVFRILIRGGGGESWATNWGFPYATTPNKSESAWAGTLVEIDYQFFMAEAPPGYVRFETHPLGIVKPVAWLKLLD